MIMTVLVTLAAMAAAPAKAPAISTQTLPWEQLEHALAFTLFVERERYTTLDPSARLVFAVEAGKGGPALTDLAVRWAVRGDDHVVAQRLTPIGEGLLSVTLDLTGYKPGRYDVTAQLVGGKDRAVLADQKGFFRFEEQPRPAQDGRIKMLLPRGVPAALKGESFPVQMGVPFPKGALADPKLVRLVDAAGKVVPSGVLVRSRWGSGDASSIRWLGVDFQPSSSAGEYALEFGPSVSAHKAPVAVSALQQDDGVKIDTGAISFFVRRRGFNVIDNIRLGNRPEISCDKTHGLYLIDHEGATYRAANDPDVKLSIEEQNDLRVVVRAEGWYVKDGTSGELRSFNLPTDRLCRFITRIEAYAGKPYVRVLSTWIITYDTFKVRLRDVGMSLPIQQASAADFGVENAQPYAATVGSTGVRLVQHLHDQFLIEDGDGKGLTTGSQSAGWVVARGAGASLAISHRDTWQRFPKEIEVLPHAVRLHVWPAHGRNHTEIDALARDQIHRLWFAHQGTELNMRMPWDYYFAVSEAYNDASTNVNKASGHAVVGVHATAMGASATSDLMVHFGASDEASLLPVAQCFQAGPHALSDPKWNCDSLAMGYIHPHDPEQFRGLEETISDHMRGYWDTQNQGNMFGMWIYRSWGHSNYNGDGSWHLYRLYNGSHHHEAVMPWVFYARSGDPFYLDFGRANIRQLSDVQIIHHAEPTYAQQEFHNHQRRVVGSTMHDNSLSPWGGDHATLGHPTCYNGLILAYYLTGDLRLREVVVDEWQQTLVANRASLDAVSADLSRFVQPRPPDDNKAQSTPGRDNANPVSELLELYQLTYDPRVLMVLSPRFDKWMNGGLMMPDWGQPLHNVLVFHGSERVRTLLTEALADHRATGGRPTLHASGLWNTGAIGVHEAYAMGGILDPKSSHAADALLFFGAAQARYNGMMQARIHPQMLSPTADLIRFIPRMMYALAHSSRQHLAPMHGDSYPMPSFYAPGRPLRCVIRENLDQPFKLHIIGAVNQPAGMDVQIFNPAGALASRVTVPKGLHNAFEIDIPADGKSGEYVVFVSNLQGDFLRVPLTAFFPEVYVTEHLGTTVDREVFGQLPGRYFTRSPGAEPCDITISNERGMLLGADQRTLLWAGSAQDKTVTKTIGPEGAWVSSYMSYVHGCYAADKSPLMVSVSPQRWFCPDAPALAVTPEP